MPSQNFPRVLIIGAAPLNQADATGITLSNLFKGWPLDGVAQIYDSESAPDEALCHRYWRFGSQDIPVVKLVKRLYRKSRTQSARAGIGFPGEGKSIAPSAPVQNGLLSAYSDAMPLQLPRNLRQWVREFRPDVIYSVLGSVRMMNIVLALSREFSLPIVPHFMDDWPNTIYRKNSLFLVPRVILNRKLRSVLDKSAAGLTIGTDMSCEFARRYGGTFSAFMNCVDFPDEKPGIVGSKRLGVRFIFSGGLHLNRWRSLITVAKALEELREEGYSVSLLICTPKKDIDQYADFFSKYAVVEKMITVQADEVNAILSTADVLVHVESFLESDSQYTRLSVSTKIPQYMAAGKPILALGPISLSSVRYVRSTHAGLVVDSADDVSAVIGVARSLCEAPSLRRELGENGRQTAALHHDARMVRARFRSLLLEATQHTNMTTESA